MCEIEKATGISFNEINWTECKIHAIAFNDEEFEFLLDIDYLGKWIEMESGYNYNISIATLVFKNVWDLNLSLEYNVDLFIQEIDRSNPTLPRNSKYVCGMEYEWEVKTINGEITFKSTGMELYIRQTFPLTTKSSLTLKERSGYSFSKSGNKLSIY
ncbi:MAG TPA: hypothetical protein PKL22_11710 [Saprospiraceae bacterium]|nr:hypothetical protein [Saprospiraceae bacterium]